DLSGAIIGELGSQLRGLRRAPGAVADRDALRDDESIDPAWVAFLITKPALADASMPQWVRWLAPLLSGVFTVDNLDYVRRDAYLTGFAAGAVVGVRGPRRVRPAPPGRPLGPRRGRRRRRGRHRARRRARAGGGRR